MICSDQNCSFPGQWTLPDAELTVTDPGDAQEVTTASLRRLSAGWPAHRPAGPVQADGPKPKEKDSRERRSGRSRRPSRPRSAPNHAKPGESVSVEGHGQGRPPLAHLQVREGATRPKARRPHLVRPLRPRRPRSRRGTGRPSTPPIKKKDNNFANLEFLEFYEGEVTWSLPLEPSPHGADPGQEVGPGRRSSYMICNDTNCSQPIYWTLPAAELTVEAAGRARGGRGSTRPSRRPIGCRDLAAADPPPGREAAPTRRTGRRPAEGRGPRLGRSATSTVSKAKDGIVPFLIFCAGGRPVRPGDAVRLADDPGDGQLLRQARAEEAGVADGPGDRLLPVDHPDLHGGRPAVLDHLRAGVALEAGQQPLAQLRRRGPVPRLRPEPAGPVRDPPAQLPAQRLVAGREQGRSGRRDVHGPDADDHLVHLHLPGRRRPAGDGGEGGDLFYPVVGLATFAGGPRPAVLPAGALTGPAGEDAQERRLDEHGQGGRRPDRDRRGVQVHQHRRVRLRRPLRGLVQRLHRAVDLGRDGPDLRDLPPRPVPDRPRLRGGQGRPRADRLRAGSSSAWPLFLAPALFGRPPETQDLVSRRRPPAGRRWRTSRPRPAAAAAAASPGEVRRPRTTRRRPSASRPRSTASPGG